MKSEKGKNVTFLQKAADWIVLNALLSDCKLQTFSFTSLHTVRSISVFRTKHLILTSLL